MIDTDKYKTKKNRNWELKVTEQENDFNYEDIIAVDSLGKESYTVAQMVDTGLEDAQLMADAPQILHALINEQAEVKKLREVIKKIKECATINAQHDDILEKQEWEYILEVMRCTEETE